MTINTTIHHREMDYCATHNFYGTKNMNFIRKIRENLIANVVMSIWFVNCENPEGFYGKFVLQEFRTCNIYV